MTQKQNRMPRGGTRRPLVIGLTGGIGSGKSTVAALFAARGITVVDADRLAHDLVNPGEPAFRAVTAALGPQSVMANGTLDRAWLRRRIHTNPEDKQKLESILHPRIRACMEARLAAAEGPYVLAVIPLLLETGQQELVDRILVVDIPEALQQARVAERDALAAEEISHIMASQTDRATRLAAADDIIDNSGDRRDLEQQVQTLHERYQEYAGVGD